MTIEEKLENFYNISMEHARQESAGEIENYEKALEKIFEEHKAAAEKLNDSQLKIEEEESRRVSNMEVSAEQIQLKRTMSRREEELKDQLFEEVERQLQAYKKTPAYVQWLKDQIVQELAFDEKAFLRIYIDPSDEALLPEMKALIQRDNAEILISHESFLGGSRGVIHERNILIDNSLKKKLEEVREDFRLREELQNG